MVIDVLRDVHAYYLPELMDAYGEPGGIWVDAYSGWAFNYDPRHVAIHVYYPDQGIFAQYDAPDGEVRNGMAHNCITNGPLLYLWIPEPELSYTDAVERLGLNFQFPFLPVSEALGMNVHTFYQTFKGSNQEVCLETPLSLWVWGVTPTPTP